jgi:hypothetical protein
MILRIAQIFRRAYRIGHQRPAAPVAVPFHNYRLSLRCISTTAKSLHFGDRRWVTFSKLMMIAGEACPHREFRPFAVC